jgi:hypothetical protein
MAKDKLEKALANVNSGRRGFLKGMLLGGATLAALPLITSTVVGQDQGGAAPAPDAGTDDTKKKKKKKKADDGSGGAPPSGDAPKQ